MSQLSRVMALSISALLASSTTQGLLAESKAAGAIDGVWQGFATVRETQQVPVTVRISGSGANLKAEFLNGPATDPVFTHATSVTFDGTHLVAQFDYFARKFDAVLTDGTLTGTYGTAVVSTSPKVSTPTPIKLSRVAKVTDPASSQSAPNLQGSWEIATTSNKGEKAWEFRVDPPAHGSAVIKTVIQRIDGDTGGLWGTWNGTAYNVGHFNAAGPALYSVVPQPDGTLLIKSLLGGVHGSAPELIARRAVEARKQNLPAPTEPTQQTSVKDPSVPFTFSFPDLKGKVISNSDPEFRDKVVIVAVGGSWCPNCHDEAPFLVSLYKKYHSRGLEIVNLDFEQGDPETDTKRLNAFINHYGITYPVLVGGTTDQLAEKIPQGVNLNCWPTSFFLGRDGRVKQTHAGFAGPGNTAGHEALQQEVTALVEQLLAEKTSTQAASLSR